MQLDSYTISALVDEFMDTLVGGRIQDVIDVDSTGIGLEIYNHQQRHYLYISADRQTPRIHIVSEKLRRGTQRPTQIGLLLRRYAESGRLVHVSQPKWERLVQLDIEKDDGEISIIVEPIPRRSNLLVVRDGTILDCMFRVGAEDNRYRVILPNHPYEPPPPFEGRLDPTDVSIADIETMLGSVSKPSDKLVKLLPRSFYGMSPVLASEVVFQASGDTEAQIENISVDALHAALETVIQPLARREWQPGVVEKNGIAEAFSVYPLTYLDGWHRVDSTSEAMNLYYGISAGPDAYNEAKKPVQDAIDEGKIKYGAKINSLESGLKDDSEREQLQQSGELILAYQYTIQPGQTELVAQYDVDGPELVITLDPDLTPLENAQRYFDRYNRAKRALDSVPELIEESQQELRYIEQLESDLEMASSWPEIDDVVTALRQMGLIDRDRKMRQIGGGNRTAPMRFTPDGYVIWLGRNSRQNEEVTFKKANPQDLWLHARDVAGAHVVIRDDGRHIPETLVEKAASVAAFYSKAREENSVIVDVTHVKYVKGIKGAGPGMVTYRNERTVTVTPHNEEIFENG
ncbi:MAG: NFACT family protein [Anaerolineae bacterium]|nr:NFACT family protein [Anaerolineae bacterium]